MNPHLDELFEKAKRLPMEPGVYYMKNADGKIIYVGKAKMLRNRVSQYFTNVERHLPKTYKMVSNVATFDYIVTSSELEAFVLECSEIKHYTPQYNILLKDGKTYPYIKVTVNESYPRVEMTRKREDDGAKYFGPFTGNVKEIVSTVNKTFRLPQCGHSFPQDIGKNRPCLNYQMKTCCGVCTGKISRKEYADTIASVLHFLNGNYTVVIKELQQQMQEASDQTEYEKAARLRDRIFAVKKLADSQQVVDNPSTNRDVFGICVGDSQCVIVILIIRNGRLVYKHQFALDSDGFENREEGFSQFLLQYYMSTAEIPKEILLPFELPDAVKLAEVLSQKRNRKVSLHTAGRGNGAKLLDMAENNAKKTLELNESRKVKQSKAVEELCRKIGLEKPARYIESVDISNTAGSENVGAIVRFTDGMPDKNGYKLFQIKGFDGQDDCASIREVLSRRFNDYVEEKKGFEQLPDLLLIDGGKGQTLAAKEVVEAFGFPIAVYGMVKDDHHRTRGLTDGENEIEVKMTSASFTLMARIQEEVHRFVIRYHRKKRGDNAIISALDGIAGIGKSKKKALLKRFKTVSAIQEASVDELTQAEGIGRKLAECIFHYFNG